MSSKPKFRRRNYFINKEFQGRAIFQYFLLIIAGSVLFALIFSIFSSNTISIVYEDYRLNIGTTPGILLERLFSAQWFVIVFAGALIILFTLFLTHRVAGPFYRFEKSLETMLRGDIRGTIHLRKKDEGKLVAGRLNEFNRMIASRLTEIEALNREIRDLAGRPGAEARESAEAGAADPETLSRIREKSEKIDALINKFTFERQ
ncbi:MAG: methyl-accepting chemotaxis protein [Desulfosalsimonadaceae bacterium]